MTTFLNKNKPGVKGVRVDTISFSKYLLIWQMQNCPGECSNPSCGQIDVDVSFSDMIDVSRLYGYLWLFPLLACRLFIWLRSAYRIWPASASFYPRNEGNIIVNWFDLARTNAPWILNMRFLSGDLFRETIRVRDATNAVNHPAIVRTGSCYLIRWQIYMFIFTYY